MVMPRTTPIGPEARDRPTSHTGAMLLLGLVALALVFALSAFWPGGGTTSRVVEPTAAPAPADPRVAQGMALAARFGCVACHTADGTRGVGPTWKGLYGTQVQLDSGQTVQADDAFLTGKIRNPGSVTVAGYPAGLMGPSIQSYQDQLGQPDTMSALLAYIHSLQ
jgi:cytochrome c oxidase subunit 2